jgi:uroporphyrinogen-III synthase
VRVIVTRVQPQADAWVEKLVALGHDAVALPLIEVRALTDVRRVRAVWQQWAGYSAVMFVSSHAVDFFFKENQPLALDVYVDAAIKTRVWATGPSTGKALLKQGVAAELLDMPPAQAGQFDSEALWQVVGSQVKPGDRVLIVRGNTVAADGDVAVDADSGVGRDWLAQCLKQAGAEVEFVVAYERGAPTWSPAQRALAHAAAQDGSVWLFSSAEALDHLRGLMPGVDWSSARAVATHPRIVAATSALGFGLVRPSRPTLDDVVSSIESMP